MGSAAQADTALAAVRVLGCDALAPELLHRVPVAPREAETVREALQRLPVRQDQPVELRMISTAVEDVASQQTVPVPSLAAQEAHSQWLQEMENGDWRALARSLAWLAPMAWPKTSTFVMPYLRTHASGVGRGLTRALLRRDFATAARLARWAALAGQHGGDVGLDLTAVVRHLELCGGGGPVTALHTAVARHLVAPGEAS